MTNVNYPPRCSGCPSEFIAEPPSLNDFKDRCPLPGTDTQLFRRWGYVVGNGGNCARAAVSDIVTIDLESVDEQNQQ